MLAQQASGYDVGGRNFHDKKPMHKNFSFSRAGADQSAPVSSTDSLSTEA
jgi:hypothetical protein